MTSTQPDEPTATVEQRDNGRWAVTYRGTVVGYHRAKYMALRQAQQFNQPEQSDPLTDAARTVVTIWRRLNTEGPGTPDDLELALDNAIAALEDEL